MSSNNSNETDDPFQGVTVKALHLKAGNKAISKKKKSKTLQPQQLQQQLLDRTSLHSTPSPPPESIKFSSGLAVTATGIKKTKAELMFEAAQRKRMLEKAAAMAEKTHKQRVQEFNEKLEKLSEHYDIPKVGPG